MDDLPAPHFSSKTTIDVVSPKKVSPKKVSPKEIREGEEEYHEDIPMEANILTMVYFVIIFFTTGFILYMYPAKDGEFWYIFLGFMLWIVAGMLAIWYAWMNRQPGFAVFFFIVFVGLYWIGFYNRLTTPHL